MLGLVTRHSCFSVSVRACRGYRLDRLQLQRGLSNGAHHRPNWVAMARSRKNRRQEEEEREHEADLDSTIELMGQMEQKIDIDMLLNDEEAMAALRNKLLAEMRSHHGAEAVAAAAPAPPRSRAFDSDEYDAAVLESGNETESFDELNDFAREAASKLALQSKDIADHILAEHKDDKFIDTSSAGDASSRNSRSTKQQQQQQKGKRITLPAFMQQQQATDNGFSSKPGSGNAGRNGSKQSSSSSRSSGESARRDSSGAAKLTGDTAIGRVAAARPGTAVVVLRKGKARLFESGSPMVYSGAVDSVIGRPPPAAGDVVVVADYNMVPLAWGVFNPVSMFRVRILQLETEALSDDTVVLDVPALVDLRVRQAVALRAALGLPSASTDAFRLLNSEGDRLSGVVADQLGNVMVVQSCAAWSERYRTVITDSLLKHTTCTRVVWRPATSILKEEGIEVQPEPVSSPDTSPLSSQSEDPSSAAADPRQVSAGDQQYEARSRHDQLINDAVQVHEAGLAFLATPEGGQKTGFYADQRLNRAFIASMAAGKTVLDLCCYSGGFGIMAAAAGAVAVTGVDSSASAVELAAANAELNGLSDRCAFVRDDVSTFLRAALEAGQGWDIVILDPPKLAPSRSSLPRASQKYKRLNTLALGVVRSGGILMTCSCSGAMTQSGGLAKIVQDAAAEAERQVTLLSKSGAAPDHPLHPAYPEGEYLTALTYRVV